MIKLIDMNKLAGSYLLIGPPLSGKRIFLYEYLKNKLENNIGVIFVTTDKLPENIKKELIKENFFFGKYSDRKMLMFIDCYSNHIEEFLPDTDNIKRISSPIALNEISIALSNIERDFVMNGLKHTVIFNSLSTLLMYSNPQTIARFLQVIIAKIEKSDGSSLFTIEQGMHDEKTIFTIEHLMKGVIKIKEENNKIIVNIEEDGNETTGTIETDTTKK